MVNSVIKLAKQLKEIILFNYLIVCHVRVESVTFQSTYVWSIVYNNHFQTLFIPTNTVSKQWQVTLLKVVHSETRILNSNQSHLVSVLRILYLSSVSRIFWKMLQKDMKFAIRNFI